MFRFIHRQYHLPDVSGNIVVSQGGGVESESFALKSKHFKVNKYMKMSFKSSTNVAVIYFSLLRWSEHKLISSLCRLAELNLLSEIEEA